MFRRPWDGASLRSYNGKTRRRLLERAVWLATAFAGMTTRRILPNAKVGMEFEHVLDGVVENSEEIEIGEFFDFADTG